MRRISTIINMICFVLSLVVAIVNSYKTIGYFLYSLYLNYLRNFKFDLVIGATLLSMINVIINMTFVLKATIQNIIEYYNKKTFKLKNIIYWGIMLILSVISLYLYLTHYIMEMV